MHYLCRDWATSLSPAAVIAFLSHTTLVSVELIVSALASILAPISPIWLPLMSRDLRVLLPRALITTVVSTRNLESATLSDSRAWRETVVYIITYTGR